MVLSTTAIGFFSLQSWQTASHHLKPSSTVPSTPESCLARGIGRNSKKSADVRSWGQGRGVRMTGNGSLGIEIQLRCRAEERDRGGRPAAALVTGRLIRVAGADQRAETVIDGLGERLCGTRTYRQLATLTPPFPPLLQGTLGPHKIDRCPVPPIDWLRSQHLSSCSVHMIFDAISWTVI